jgi:hypothetical protein
VGSAALMGGYSLGQCCVELNRDLGYSSQLTVNSGIVIALLLFSWLLLLFLAYFNSKCYNIENKLSMLRYFTFTLHLVTLLSLAYNAMNALVYY